ncbi:MAG: DnaJ domain-containing protein [Myxococcota bacterium]|nr:DnaJ domain-containing protein [Myxococcota bacterium]
MEATSKLDMNLWRRLINVARSNLQRHAPKPIVENHEVFDSQPDGDAFGPSHWPASQPNPLEARYYANLELAPGASYSEIKAAYRRLLSKYHPDKHHQTPEQTETAGEISKGLNEAMAYFEKTHKGGR